MSIDVSLTKCFPVDIVVHCPGCAKRRHTRSGKTVPSSAEEIRTHLDVALEKRNETRKILLDNLKRRLENQPSWLRVASLGFNLRSYGFKLVNRNNTYPEWL